MGNAQQQEKPGTLVVSEQKLELFQGWMKYNRKRIEIVVPRGTDPKRIYTMAMSELYRDPALLNCDPRSFILSVIQSAKMGLELGPHLGHAYLVPFTKGGKGKGGAKIIQLVPGYRGIIKSLIRAKQVVDVDGIVVYENDEFDLQRGTNRGIIHRPAIHDDPGKAIGAYAVFWMREGTPKFEWMNLIDLNKIQEFSPSSKRADSPWQKWPDQMRKKCPIRRGSNQLVLDTIAGAAMLLQAGAEGGEAKTDEVAELLGTEADDPEVRRGPRAVTVDAKAETTTDDIASKVRARREQAEAEAREDEEAEGSEPVGDEENGGDPPEAKAGPPTNVAAFLEVIEEIETKAQVMGFMARHDEAISELKEAGDLSADDIRTIFDALETKEKAVR